MPSLTATAQARVGLLGNPSDIYGGRGLGFAVRELGAAVTLTDAAALTLPDALLRAGWQLMQAELAQHGIDAASRPFALTTATNIPLQAGLSGSSALLVAALRAWCRWFALPLPPLRLAELAFCAENDVLGIRAGPLDRLVQAHDGLLAMDFAAPFTDGAIARLDPALLPPLLLAWHGTKGQASGDVHAPVFARWQQGDPLVRTVMQQLAANADAGRQALGERDLAQFRRCVDRNFDLRAHVFAIDASDRALVEFGRGHGAAAKFPGSGGAVLFACRDEEQRAGLERACRARGHTTLAPTVQPPLPRIGAVFLAAGFATRLYPLTLYRAKPLLEVGGQPLLTRIVGQVAAMGTCRRGVVVTNARFHGDFVRWHAAARSRLSLQLVDDGARDNDTRLGAVRDLALGLEQSAPHDDVDAWLVLACDNLFEFDLAELATSFATTGRGQLLVREVPTPVPAGKYSEIVLDGPRVARFREKPHDPQSNLSAIAVYLLPRNLPALVRDYLAAGGNPDAPGHLLAWLAGRQPLHAHRLTGRWLDIGSADDLAAADALWRG